ncbi:molybdate ABC transporter substrate-binding protein [Desulfocurvus sp.]|jgi:molybdate transport system substrate-binding protein|uniref:molybdate ABC transporter substrate-binding protein n=1 Tax=Desulfocurvus sp. TaxID=2871698 RepID=UPI0025C122EB|nr:molybdate ABC transporter substrate-binding protein [Desulfocurvus sp.]MCK9240505.1 molybdate ABC transporter substrate-binding protein [Desulfocurvus sp.]
MKRFASLLAVLLLLAAPAQAADLLLAQAANFTPAMKEIIPLFEKATGLKAEATYTSTGKLYGQIVNGAPFDILLAANEATPAKLLAEGRAEEPFVYAKGRVVLWTLKKELCAMSWPEAVRASTKVAIANVETAPYGTASMQAMQAVGLWEEIQPALVFGQNISQPFQFASTGAADVGFCALSSTFTPEGGKGCFLEVPEAPKVIQAACVLKSAPNPEAARRFVEFLHTPEVAAIKAKYGYE